MLRPFVLVVATLLTACSDRSAESSALVQPQPAAADSRAGGASVNRYLAYEHSVSVKTDAEKVVALAESVQAACRAAVDDACAILGSDLSRGDDSRATLRLRAKASGIQKLIGVVSAQGEIEGQSTTAEDLGGPIEDNEKKLAMLTAYRGQLEALRGRANADVDSLIKLTRELADVQSQIEQLSGSQAQLLQRVKTEILTVSIYSSGGRSFWSPIADASSDFGSDLSEAIGVTITAIAFLLPWVILLVGVVWVWRVVRRRRRAKAA